MTWPFPDMANDSIVQKVFTIFIVIKPWHPSHTRQKAQQFLHSIPLRNKGKLEGPSWTRQAPLSQIQNEIFHFKLLHIFIFSLRWSHNSGKLSSCCLVVQNCPRLPCLLSIVLFFTIVKMLLCNIVLSPAACCHDQDRCSLGSAAHPSFGGHISNCGTLHSLESPHSSWEAWGCQLQGCPVLQWCYKWPIGMSSAHHHGSWTVYSHLWALGDCHHRWKWCIYSWVHQLLVDIWNQTQPQPTSLWTWMVECGTPSHPRSFGALKFIRRRGTRPDSTAAKFPQLLLLKPSTKSSKTNIQR